MALSNNEAQRFNHEYIGTEHILLGLIKEGSGVGATALKNLDIDLRRVRLEVEKLVKSGPDMITMGKLPQTPQSKKVIESSIEEAYSLGHNYVGTEHLLLGLLREKDAIASQVLMSLGLKLDEVRKEVMVLIKPEEPLLRCLNISQLLSTTQINVRTLLEYLSIKATSDDLEELSKFIVFLEQLGSKYNK